MANALKNIEERGDSLVLKQVETTRKRLDNLVDFAKDPLVQGPLLTSKLMKDRGEYVIDQDAEDMEALRVMASRVMDHHNRVTREVAESSGGRAQYATELKGEKRMKEKFVEHGSTHKKMGDIVRTSIIFDDLESLYEAVMDLYETVEIVRVKDRFIEPRASGYRDLLFNIRLEDPQTGKDYITEIQFQLAAMHDAKDDEHSIYQERRALEQEFERLKREDPANLMAIRELKDRIEELTDKSKEKFSEAWTPHQNAFNRYEQYKREYEAAA